MSVRLDNRWPGSPCGSAGLPLRPSVEGDARDSAGRAVVLPGACDWRSGDFKQPRPRNDRLIRSSYRCASLGTFACQCHTIEVPEFAGALELVGGG
jgi:hypothetical protein